MIGVLGIGRFAVHGPDRPGFVREFQESTLAQPVPPSSSTWSSQESLKVPARVWRAAFEGFLEDDVAA